MRYMKFKKSLVLKKFNDIFWSMANEKFAPDFLNGSMVLKINF